MKNKKHKNIKLLLILSFAVLAITAAVFIFRPGRENNSLTNPLVSRPKTAEPAQTDKEYIDPSGFSFEFPDNLSINKNEITDNNTYADIQLSSKDKNGSLILKITDSNLSSLDNWLKLNTGATAQNTKETKLGNLKALEVKLSDRLLLGALDQQILFTIEMPLVEGDFWIKIYNKVLTTFTFELPENIITSANTNATVDDVIFEGEEVVE